MSSTSHSSPPLLRSDIHQQEDAVSIHAGIGECLRRNALFHLVHLISTVHCTPAFSFSFSLDSVQPTAEYNTPVRSEPPNPNSPLLIIKATLHTALTKNRSNLLFLGAWTTMIVVVNRLTVVNLVVPPTLLTVLGTILGLVLSYRWVGQEG
jgi:hypothetical protein